MFWGWRGGGWVSCTTGARSARGRAPCRDARSTKVGNRGRLRRSRQPRKGSGGCRASPPASLRPPPCLVCVAASGVVAFAVATTVAVMGTLPTLPPPALAPAAPLFPPYTPSTGVAPVNTLPLPPPSPPPPPPDLPDDVWSLLLSRPDVADADVAAVAATCRRLAAVAVAESVWHARWAARAAGSHAAAPPSAVRGVPARGGGWFRLAAAAAVAAGGGGALLVRQREGLAETLTRLGMASAAAAAVAWDGSTPPSVPPVAEGGDGGGGTAGRGRGGGLALLAVFGGLLLVGVTGMAQVVGVSTADGEILWSVGHPRGVVDARAAFFVVDDAHWAFAGAGPPGGAAAACLFVHVFDLDGRAVEGAGGDTTAEAPTLAVPLPAGTALLPAWAHSLRTAPSAVAAVFPTARPRAFVVGVAPPSPASDDTVGSPPGGGGDRILSHLVVFVVPFLPAGGPSSFPLSPYHRRHPPSPISLSPPPTVLPVVPAMASVAAWRLARAVSPVSGGLAFVGTVVRVSGAPFGSPVHAGGDEYEVRGLGHGELLGRFAVPPGTGLVDVVAGGGAGGLWGWRSVALSADDAPMRLHVRRGTLDKQADGAPPATGGPVAGVAAGAAAPPVGSDPREPVEVPPRSPSPTHVEASVLLRDAFPSPFAADVELRGSDGFFFHRPLQPPVEAPTCRSWGAAAAAAPPVLPRSAAAATATCVAAGIAPALLGRFFSSPAGRGGGGGPPTGTIRSFLPSAGDAFGHHSRLVYARLGGGPLSWADLTPQGGTLLLGSAASGVLAAFGVAPPAPVARPPADAPAAATGAGVGPAGAAASGAGTAGAGAGAVGVAGEAVAVAGPPAADAAAPAAAAPAAPVAPAPVPAAPVPATAAPSAVRVGIGLGTLRFQNAVNVPIISVPASGAAAVTPAGGPRSVDMSVPSFVALSAVPGGVAATLSSSPWAVVWRFVKKATV